MIRPLRQQELYHEAAAAYSHALERLVRAYEADTEKQREVIVGAFLALLAWEFRDSRKYPSLMTLGLVLAICRSLRYISLQREYPKVRAEFEGCEKLLVELRR